MRKTLTLALSEGAAGEINSKGIEKTGGYPNGEEISLSRQRSPRELCGAGRRRARRTRERAEAAGRGRGGSATLGLSTDQCSNQAEVQKIRSGLLKKKKSSLTSNFREWFPVRHWISKQFLLQPRSPAPPALDLTRILDWPHRVGKVIRRTLTTSKEK